MEQYCINCMKKLNASPVCAHCGWDNSCPPQTEPYHLPPGTLLAGRYLVGNVIGEGGFGITYIGLHTKLTKRVAIKEFYPSGAANRTSMVSDDVIITKDRQEFFSKGVERFLAEAKNLAAVSGEDGIVDVIDYFQENNTAYIVMEYLEGMTLKDYVNRNGLFHPDQLIALLMPLMRSLSVIHSNGIIHRDISPDNIMSTTNGKLKLMDFGSARYFTNEDRQMSVILKQGFAPEEQYRTNGNQGPHTDIYSLCATIYTCITGRVPDNSLDRLAEDKLLRPSQLGVSIRPQHENALMHGLAVKVADRTPDINTLINEFSASDGIHTVYTEAPFRNSDVPPYQSTTSHPNPWQQTNTGGQSLYDSQTNNPVQSNDPVPTKNRLPLILGIAIPSVAVVAALIVLAVVFFNRNSQPETPPEETSASVMVETTVKPTETKPEGSSSVSSKASSTASKSEGLSLSKARLYPDKLSEMMLPLIPDNDEKGSASDKYDICDIYYASANDSDYTRLVFVYRNESQNYYRAVQIDPENVSIKGGEAEYNATYFSFSDPDKDKDKATKNNMILGSSASRFSVTQILGEEEQTTVAPSSEAQSSKASSGTEETLPSVSEDEKGLSENDAVKYPKELAAMMQSRIAERDESAASGDKIEIKNIYYARSNTNTDFRRLVFVYENVTGKYFRSVQISPEYVTDEKGKMIYNSTYLSFDDTGKTLAEATENSWYLSKTYTKYYYITTIM